MSNPITNALTLSGVEKLLRELNLRFQSCRMDLVRFHHYLMVCSSTSTDKELSFKFRNAALKMGVALDKMSIMGRKWEEVLIHLHDVENLIMDIETYLALNSDNPDNEFNLKTLRMMDKKFGIKFLSYRLIGKIKKDGQSISYLQIIFSHLHRANPENQEVEDINQYLNQIITSIRKVDAESMSIQDCISFIKVLRYVNETITIRHRDILN